jgi:hypothetical protein
MLFAHHRARSEYSVLVRAGLEVEFGSVVIYGAMGVITV